jgi:hypothetical protein
MPSSTKVPRSKNFLSSTQKIISSKSVLKHVLTLTFAKYVKKNFENFFFGLVKIIEISNFQFFEHISLLVHPRQTYDTASFVENLILYKKVFFSFFAKRPR